MKPVATSLSAVNAPSKGALWTGRVIFPVSTIVAIGAVLLVCTLLYVIPQTSVLGAILLTAHLGGAVAVQVRVGHPLFESSFPIIFGVLVWLGVYLREPRLRAFVPLRTQQ